MSINRARQLRKTLTPEERKIWNLLRVHFSTYKFRRQVPIEGFIVDFISYKLRLIIEIDGGQHNEMLHKQADMKRDEILRSNNFEVLCFWNSEVSNNLEGIYKTIQEKIGIRSISPSPDS